MSSSSSFRRRQQQVEEQPEPLDSSANIRQQEQVNLLGAPDLLADHNSRRRKRSATGEAQHVAERLDVANFSGARSPEVTSPKKIRIGESNCVSSSKRLMDDTCPSNGSQTGPSTSSQSKKAVPVVSTKENSRLATTAAANFSTMLSTTPQNGFKRSSNSMFHTSVTTTTPLGSVGKSLISVSRSSGQSAVGGASGGSGRKLVVRSMKDRPKLPANFILASLEKLEAAVCAIQESRSVPTSLEELYQAVENLCAHKQASATYDMLKSLCEKHSRSQLPELLKTAAGRDLVDFMKIVAGCWQKHCAQMIMIRSIFLFLDRTFVLQNSTVLSIWDLGLDLFRSIVMNEKTIERRLVEGILHLIDRERGGEQIEKGLVKNLLRMLSSLQIYQQMFEGRFMEETDKLYRNEGQRLVQEMDLPTYLHHVEKRLAEENERFNYYLDYCTRKPLVASLETYFIHEHVQTMLQKGLDHLLEENRVDDLQLLYSLLSRVRIGLASLKNSFAAYIKKVGKAMVLNTERDKTLVQDLMDLKERLDGIVSDCFKGDDKFVQAQKDAHDYFINTRANRPAELVAKFMDGKLRSGNKEATDEELEKLMDKVIVLFRFIQGKDVFEAFYKKDLAKRLLLSRSASVDAEKSMLSKLKQECGAGFTSKLEGMFKDMELSKDLNTAYRQFLKGAKDGELVELNWPSVDFTANILTMGHWPTYPPTDVHMPPQMVQYQEVFTKFYLGKHSGRKLQWQSNLDHCLLKARFKPGVEKELQVSLYQSLVLLLFNTRLCWTFADIQASTNIEVGELKRTLQSLSCGKFRPIVKTQKGKEINEGDGFTFNSECNDRLYRIRISQVQMKETEEEQTATTEQVFQDRQYQIDAAIVRIMKTRKTLGHNLLISELFNQLRFPAKPGDLKKRIESLIDRDYVCRDKDDSNVYHYVA